MCGIFGYASLHPPDPSPAWQGAFSAMAYRGPDARGLYLAPAQLTAAVAGQPRDWVRNPAQTEDELRAVWPTGPAVLFGHLRLAIIDLQTASDQPMVRDNLTLIFNGEIYNYIELRAELMALGQRFHTHGDSEVILAAYQQWGRDGVQRLRGMFTIAIHDSTAGTLWLARDRFAIKPLYLAQRPGALAFASEAKVLPLLFRETAVPHDRALYHLLAYWANAFDGDTFFSGVEAVRPGEELLIDLNSLVVERRRYYDLRQFLPGLEMLPDSADTIGRFRDCFDEAIRLHLRADVPLGVGLSGGLDSSAVLGTIAARHLAGGHELAPDAAARGELLPACPAFSSIFGADPEVDEGRYIRAVLQQTGVPSHTVTPDFEPLLAKLPVLSRLHDGPLTSPSLLVQHAVMGLAKSCGVTVIINGQGADELLGGYLRFIVLHTLGELRRRPWRGVGTALEVLFHGDPQIPRLIMSRLLRRQRSQPVGQQVKRLGQLLNPDRFGQFAAEPHPAPYTTDMQALRVQDLQTWPIPALCQNEDRNSMYFSLESRVPLLDHVLVELCLRLPPTLLFRRGLPKYILRAAMRGRVPDSVLWRRGKLGFPAPEQRWLGSLSHGAFRARLTAEARLREVFSARALGEAEWAGLDPRQRWLLLATDAWLGTV